MGGRRIDGSGSNVQFLWGEQTSFDTPVRPETRLRLKLPEDLKANREFYISDEPTPQRGRTDIVETSRAASGPLNFDIRTEGLGPIYKGALGSDEDVLTIANADGGIRCQVAADYTNLSTYLFVDWIPDGFNASGNLAIAFRTDGDPAKALDSQTVAYSDIQYTASGGRYAFHLSAALADPNVKHEDYVFLYDAGYTGVYTHVYAAGRKLNTVSTYGILRDIVAFYYYSCKTSTLTETYDNQSVISGSVEVFAGDEFYGGILNGNVQVDDTTITVDDVDNDIRNIGIFYPNTSEKHYMWIGDESGIEFTAIDDNPVSGTYGQISGIPVAAAPSDYSITLPHYIEPEKEVVAMASVKNVPLGDLDSALASYNAGLYAGVYEYRYRNLPNLPADATALGVFGIEVLSANWTLNNNLYTEKIPLGTRERVALPEGMRDVTGTIHVEFDSPEEYNRVTRGTPMRLEIHGVDALTDIAGTGVAKRNDTVFPKVKFLEATPTAASTDLIEYDLNFRALTPARWPEVIKVIVNGQTSALAGG